MDYEELCERLQSAPSVWWCQDAASAIKTMKAENERLRAALEAMAKSDIGIDVQPDGELCIDVPALDQYDMWEIAREALEQSA